MAAVLDEFYHHDYKLPSVVYRYTDEFVIAEYPPNESAGTLTVKLHPWSRHGQEWMPAVGQRPFPLFWAVPGDNGTKDIFIVQGEKNCLSVGSLGLSNPVCTWYGSNKSFKDFGPSMLADADWNSIRGRGVILWMDGGEEGRRYAAELAELLYARYACRVRIVRNNAPDGFNCRTAMESGKDAAWIKNEYIKPRLYDWEPQEAVPPREVVVKPKARITKPVEELIEASDEPDPQSRMALWSVVGLELKDKGHPYPSMDNALRIFTAELCDNGCHYDPFLNQIMVRGSSDEPHKPLTDEFILGYVLLCQRKYGIQNMRKSDMHDAINLYAKNHVFNSLTDWLTKLTWDGVSRVEAFCNLGLGSPDTEYTRGVSVCFLIGMIARAIRPGCQVDCMPVLEGLQGIGKSRALEALAGTEKFADIDAPMGSKRFSEDIQGKWLVELSELSAMRPSEIETIKSTITRTVDVYRVPWDRLSTSHPRQCVFAGTTNADAYLSDHENRRFWPIKCGNINKHWIETNREQLFAEALVMFHQGDSWWNVNQAAHNEEVQKRRILDSMQDAVDNYLSTNDGDVKVSAILESFEVPKSQWSPSLQKRVGECLKHAGYFKTVTKGLRVYRRVDSQTVVQPFRVLHAQKKAGE